MKGKKYFYYGIKSIFWKSLLAPIFIPLFEHKVEFFIYTVFIFVAGQLGTIINLIQRTVFGDWTFSASIAQDSASGSFYIFALVLMASLLAPLFNSFITNARLPYRRIVMVFVTIMIFSLLLSAVFYSVSSLNMLCKDYSQCNRGDLSLDGWQFTFFILAILSAWYSFGYSKIPEHERDLQLSDDYNIQDDAHKEKLLEETTNVNNDGEGIAL